MPKLLLFPSSVLRTVLVEGKGQCSPIKMHCRWAFASNAVLIHREHVATLCNQLLERTVAENIKQPSSSTIALSTVISLLPEDSLRIFTKNVHSERKGCIGLSSLTNALPLSPFLEKVSLIEISSKEVKTFGTLILEQWLVSSKPAGGHDGDVEKV
uniref:Uncharacterized protein n=1 Tax=Vespula pensylvanica TaxID=30213 RepID=A0A834UFK4_VESPE|nr:hypothetical protein H0235_003706 [Vespula pensylvanica]